MRFYFAPMEGITTYLYRKLHHKYFGGAKKYFAPFISPTMHGSFTPREKKDILPEHNEGIVMVPQILTNQADYFMEAAKELYDYGYPEINLNLGCPSNTVVTKCKGSGFLSETYQLEKFFDEIFKKAIGKISVKTRIGRYDEEEFEELLRIFNQYPIEELIIHPRVQQDYYKNPVHTHVFLEAIEKSRNPLCYNGDIYTKEDYQSLIEQCPKLQSVMLGRGAIANPNLFQEIQTGELISINNFWAFHDELYEEYQQAMGNNALYKMKELWIYMGNLFPDVDKIKKKIKKAQKKEDYQRWVQELRHLG
ncbi:MAG: tRNA-dihydrouridine synthase family protein [Lachnospiraceae bacterium]|nr:tRNA-dihydrouridine synthase family protein [Lachnospiraceae bacterium]